MTLVVAVTGSESIWMLVDRRLSIEGGPPKDDGRKVMFLEATDGVAMLGYAGLGATALGVEPADWMSAVLRNRKFTLEGSLGILANAVQQQLPKHLIQIPVSYVAAHHVIVPAFVGAEPRLYAIQLVLEPDRKSYEFQYRRLYVDGPVRNPPNPPRVGIGGSGALHLAPDTKWMRDVLRLVNANDSGKISATAVADHLATLNYEVHRAMADKSVGPRCIVAWRFRKGGARGGGGGHQFYTRKQRDPNSPSLPTIVHGMDVPAIVKILRPHSEKGLKAMMNGEPIRELDKNELNSELARLPNKPDEDLC